MAKTLVSIGLEVCCGLITPQGHVGLENVLGSRRQAVAMAII